MSKASNARRAQRRRIAHKQKERHQEQILKNLLGKARVRADLSHHFLKVSGLKTRFLQQPSVRANLQCGREQLVNSRPPWSTFLVQRNVFFCTRILLLRGTSKCFRTFFLFLLARSSQPCKAPIAESLDFRLLQGCCAAIANLLQHRRRSQQRRRHSALDACSTCFLSFLFISHLPR